MYCRSFKIILPEFHIEMTALGENGLPKDFSYSCHPQHIEDVHRKHFKFAFPE